jgi:hypothetical protein
MLTFGIPKFTTSIKARFDPEWTRPSKSCPPLETFQIGWICALPIEAAIAKEMLDEVFRILDEQHLSDSNTYILGRISKYHAVIACLPAANMELRRL